MDPRRRLVLLGVMTPLLAVACRPRPPAELAPTEPGSTADGRTDQRSGTAPIVFPDEARGSSSASPERLCDHVIELVRSELGPQADSISPQEMAELRASCVNEGNAERQRIGEAAFARQAECVLATRHVDELARCDIEDGTSIDSTDATDSQSPSVAVCEHLKDLMLAELTPESREFLTPQDVTAFVNTCLSALSEARAEIGEERFEFVVNCMLAAQTTDQVARCDPG